MTDAVKPEVGQEAWLREKYFSRIAVRKGKIVRVTPSLQVVVEYTEKSGDKEVVRQERFKPSRWRGSSSSWDHMGGGGYSHTYWQMATGAELTDALKLEWRRDAAQSRSARKVRNALETVQNLSLDDRYAQIGAEKLKAAKAVVQELLDTLEAALELQQLPEPPASTENDE